MVDSVVHRHDLKATVARLSRLLMKPPQPVPAAVAESAEMPVELPKAAE